MHARTPRPSTAANLAYAEAPEELVAAALEEFGRLDILINNASSFYPTPVGKITDPDVGRSDRRATCEAPLFLAQAAAPSLAKQRGLIINMVDIHGLRPLKGYPVYSAAKAGLAMLTRSLARELGAGHPRQRHRAGAGALAGSGMDEALKREIVGKTALKRHGSPQDIARTALFLAQGRALHHRPDHRRRRRPEHLERSPRLPFVEHPSDEVRCRPASGRSSR